MADVTVNKTPGADELVNATSFQRAHKPLFDEHETPLHIRLRTPPAHIVKAYETSLKNMGKPWDHVKKAFTNPGVEVDGGMYGKIVDNDGKMPSNQGVWWGLKVPPFDIRTIKNFLSTNVQHAVCVYAKTAAYVGMGFRSPTDKLSPAAPGLGEPLTGPVAGDPGSPQAPNNVPTTIQQEDDAVSKALDEYCDTSFLDVLIAAVQDYVQVGNGWIEVVRAKDRPAMSAPNSVTTKGGPGEIRGLYPLMAEDITIIVENALYNRHFQVITTESAGMRWFADFGDLDGFKQRIGRGTLQAIGLPPPSPDLPISEVIHLRQPTSLSRWYGWPDWVAGCTGVELMQCLYQHNYDFFLNRGVPEFILFVMGKMLQQKDWKKIEQIMQQNIGLGNSHKSAALNLPEEVKIDLHKLALEGKTDGGFQELHDPLALDIVSAHRVPHLLAGIQIPGKLGAANELPNALMAFQVLVAGPAQATIGKTLAATLGNPALNGGIALTKKDFVFREIIDRIDIGKTDTMSRMRQPVAQAQAQGRDLGDGLLKELIHNQGMAPEEATAQVLRLYSVALELSAKRVAGTA
jgi:hypothetical protein